MGELSKSLLERNKGAREDSIPDTFTPVGGGNVGISDQLLGRNPDARLNLSMEAAQKKQPDQAARVMQLQMKTGLPSDLIERNLDRVEQKVARRDFDPQEFRRESPMVAKWMEQNPDHAAIARDDISTLTGIEWLFKAAPEAFSEGQAQVRVGMLGYKQMTGEELTEEELEYLEKTEASLGQRDYGNDGWLESAVVEGGKLLPTTLGALRYGLEGGLAGATTFTGAALAAGQLGPQVATPEEIVTVPLSATAGFGLGSRAGAAEFAFELEAGLAYREFIQMEGLNGERITPEVARVAATLSGSLNAGLEVFALDVLVKSIPGGDKLLNRLGRDGVKKALRNPTFLAALTNFAKNYGKVITAETATEVMQELSTTLAGEIAKQASEGEFESASLDEITGRLGETMVRTAQGMTFLALPGPGANVAIDVTRARKAKQRQAMVESLGSGAKASKLRERMPEKFQEFVEQATADGDIENIYIPVDKWDEYFQSQNADPASVAAEVMGDDAAYREAQATGGDVAIPVGQYAAKIAGSEAHEGLSRNIRFNPDDMTLAEAELFEANMPEIMEQAVGEQGEGVTDTSENVYQDVLGQLLASSVERSAAERQAQMVQSVFRTLGERTGIDPMELYQQYGLEVAREIPAELQPFVRADTGLDPLLDRLRSGDIPSDRDIFGASLVDFLRSQGGIRDDGGEVSGMDPDADRLPGQRSLVSAEGIDLDTAAEMAAEQGFIEERDINALLEAIDQEIRGEPVFAAGAENQQLQETARALSVMEEELGRLGVDIETTDNGTLKALLVGDLDPAALQDETARDDAETLLDQPSTLSRIGQAIAGGPEIRVFERDGSTVYAAGEAELQVNVTPNAVQVESIGVPPADRRRGVGRALYERAIADAFAENKAFESDRNLSDAAVAVWERLQREGYEVERNPDAVTTDKGTTFVPLEAADRAVFKIMPPAVEGTQDQYLVDGQQVEADPDTARGVAIRSLARPDQFPLDDLLDQYESAGQQEFADEVRAEVADLQGRVGFEQQLFQGEDVLFQQGRQAGRRGSIQFTQADERGRRRFRINLLQNSDLSTFLHETGHFYLEVLGDLAQRGDAPQQIMDDYQTILDWFGVKDRKGIKVDQHEQFARGFEAYLMEGKAPSPELAGAFARFRAWLVGVYRQIKNLNVELTDEVRGVFDRLVATDSEIAAAKESRAYEALFTEEEARQAGMSPEEYQAYQQSIEDANREATEEVTRKAMSEFQREEKKWWNDERAKMREKVAEEVNSRPVYQAMHWLQKGTLPDGREMPPGTDHAKLDRQVLVDRYGKEFLKRLPRPYVYTREGGIHPDEVAPMFGYSSGDAMIEDLVNAPPRVKSIEAETDARMRDEFGDIRTDGTLPDKALNALHNEKRADLLMRELRALGRNATRGSRPTTKQIVKAAARRIIGDKKIRNIKPHTYRTAEAKAARQAFDAVARGDYDAAYDAKRRQLLNHELYREAQKAREQADKNRDFISSFNKKSRRQRLAEAGADYLAQMDGILERYEFRNVPVRTLDRRQSLAEWLRTKSDDVNPLGDDPHMSEDEKRVRNQEEAVDAAHGRLEKLAEEAATVNWRELTSDELQGIRDNADLIWHLAKLKDSLLKQQEYARISEAAETLADSIRENANRVVAQALESDLPAEKIKSYWQQYLAAHRRLSSLAWEMDGGVDNGPAWQLLVQPLNEAADQETIMLREAGERISEIFDVYDRRELGSMFGDKRDFDGAGVSLTKQGRLAVALNWGNEINRQRIMDGYGWTQSDVQEILDSLDEKDWRFVQSVWDYIDEFWPQIAENHEAIFGLPPEKVEPTPIETRFGTMRGGYYPIKYDAAQSAKTQERALQAQAPAVAGVGDPSKRQRQGFTRSRVQGRVSLPVRLSVVDVVNQHVQEVVHSVTHDQALLDIGRILKRDEVRQAIVEHYGMPAYRSLYNVMVEVKHGPVPARNALEKGLVWVRNGATIAGLGWKFSTALLQVFGFSNSVVRVGGSWMVRGYARVIGDAAKLENASKFVTDRSEMMKTRRLSQNREINDIRNKLKRQGALTFLEESYFWMITGIQYYAVDLPTWFAAYEKSKASGLSAAKSAQVADQAVIDSQGGGQIKDLVAAQRGGPGVKLFTNFMSYMVTTYNLGAARVRTTDFANPIEVVKMGMDMLTLFTLPVFLDYILRDVMIPALREDDDDRELEDHVESLARKQASFLTGGLVGFRELGSAFEGYGNYTGPAGSRVFGDSVAATLQVMQAENDEAMWRSLNRAFGSLFHYPAGQVDQTFRGLNSLRKGETNNPAVILFGPPRDQD